MLGLLAVLFYVFGILTLVARPVLTSLYLILLCGAYAILGGIFNIKASAIRAPDHHWPLILKIIGIIGIIAGVLTFIWPGIPTIILIAFWAIFTGVLEIATGIRLRQYFTMLILMGITSLLFGVLILVGAGVRDFETWAFGIDTALWIGVYGLIFGGIVIALALRLLEHELLPSSSGGTGGKGKSPSKQVIAFLAIAAVLVVMHLAIRLFQAERTKPLATFQGHAWLTSAVFSPDGRRVLSASGDYWTALLWEADSGRLVATFQGHTRPVTSAVFSADGGRVLTASFDKTARLWEADTGKPLVTFQGHTDRLTSAVFSPDGRRLLTASWDTTARLWEADTGKPLATFQGHTDRLTSAVFSPDGRRVLTASYDHNARLWEADTGKLLATFRFIFQSHSGAVLSAVFSPDGRRVLTASWDSTARLWEADSGRLMATFQGQSWDVNSAVFSPDGRRVLTGKWIWSGS